jgi:hypothetical protein
MAKEAIYKGVPVRGCAPKGAGIRMRGSAPKDAGKDAEGVRKGFGAAGARK